MSRLTSAIDRCLSRSSPENQNDFADGWFYTGDVGYVDEEGYVFLTGRKKEIINRAGEKISPYEVEDVIREHPGVAQAAVVGLPDTLYGERVAAFVTLNRTVVSREKVINDINILCPGVSLSSNVPQRFTSSRICRLVLQERFSVTF